MKTRILASLGVVAVLWIGSADPCFGVKLPSTKGEIQNLSDEEVIGLLDYLTVELEPASNRFFQYLDQQYSVSTMTEFRGTFPQTAGFLDEVLIRNQLPSTGGVGSLAGGAGIGDAIGDAADQLDKFYERGVEILAFVNEAYDAQYRLQLTTNLFIDIQEQCGCSDQVASDLVDHWIEEFQISLAETLPWFDPADRDSANKLLFKIAIRWEILAEAAERFDRMTRICRELKNGHLVVTLPGGTPWNLTYFCKGSDRRDQNCDMSGGVTSGVAHSTSPSSITGAESSPTYDGGGERVDAPGEFWKFPPVTPPPTIVGGTPAGPGDLVPDDPSEGCFGPCCGRGGSGPGAGECWADGVPIPCYLIRQLY